MKVFAAITAGLMAVGVGAYYLDTPPSSCSSSCSSSSTLYPVAPSGGCCQKATAPTFCYPDSLCQLPTGLLGELSCVSGAQAAATSAPFIAASGTHAACSSPVDLVGAAVTNGVNTK